MTTSGGIDDGRPSMYSRLGDDRWETLHTPPGDDRWGRPHTLAPRRSSGTAIPATSSASSEIAGPSVRRWFRPEVRGFEGVGAGPCLVVANHNIGAPWEVFVLLEAW